jgi:hypothetical protein
MSNGDIGGAPPAAVASDFGENTVEFAQAPAVAATNRIVKTIETFFQVGATSI